MIESFSQIVQTIPPEVGVVASVLGSLALILTTMGGFFIWVINRMMAVLNLKVDTIQINQEANAVATLKAIQRIENIETTVNNGLSEKTEATREDMKETRKDLVVVMKQVAEIHGWIEGTHK